MSYLEAAQPECTAHQGAVELVITPKEKDLGEFTVRRVLPSKERRMVGPFIFFDHMGPAEFPPGEGIQVRPHPHIGIATITFLFEGQIMHRDSLGYTQPIRAGAVNLMTAGRGIVHSERAGDDLDETSRLHGIQSWIALPDDEQEREPGFIHYAADDLPVIDVDGVVLTLIMGELQGARSPVTTYSPTLYASCSMPRGRRLTLDADYPERALYVVSGSIAIDGEDYPAGTMAVAAAGKDLICAALEDSHVMVIGGASVGERHIWWNFVAGSKARIEQAKEDWREGRFAGVPGDDEFIPLPD